MWINTLDKYACIYYNTDTMIPRFIKKQLILSLKPQKVTGIFGARQTGKTVLKDQIKEELELTKKKVLSVNGENMDVQEILSSQRISQIKKMVEGYEYLFVDEAQKVPNIGLNLKLIVDNIPNLAVLVTGSSAFDLKNKIGEPLVGRSHYFHLYPIAQMELSLQENFLTTKENLEERLIFGSYPEIIMAKTAAEKKDKLESLKNGYLLKDILALDNIKDSLFIFNLLRLVAFQIGNDISYSELATSLNANKKTVMRYLELLEKSYIIFSLHGFSRNLRKEYTKTPRYYFCDNGIRNSLIANYNPLNSRDDIGKLWENYCITERIKAAEYKHIYANRYFWRTYDQKEIDCVEEREGKLFGFEFKWKKDKTKPPKDFFNAYPESEYKIISKENYLEFIT